MLTLNLAEDLIRRFSNNCRIEGNYFNYNNRYLITINQVPIIVKEIGEYEHFGTIIDELLGYDDNPLSEYLMSIIDSDQIKEGEEPTMCWEWNGNLYPINTWFRADNPDFNKIKDLGLIEDMKKRGFEYNPGEFRLDFLAVYKYYTGKDYIPGQVELIPSYIQVTGPFIDDGDESIREDEFL